MKYPSFDFRCRFVDADVWDHLRTKVSPNLLPTSTTYKPPGGPRRKPSPDSVPPATSAESSDIPTPKGILIKAKSCIKIISFLKIICLLIEHIFWMVIKF